MIERSSQQRHRIWITMLATLIVFLVIATVHTALSSRRSDPAQEAQVVHQSNNLPRDLIKVADAQYASLDGLALGSADAQERQRQAMQQHCLPLEVKTRRTGIVFRLIPPGTFTMGSPRVEQDAIVKSGVLRALVEDETEHQVTLSKPFYCGKYEVTQGQWEQVMESNPSQFRNAGKDAPVEQVSWNDCQAFAKKLCQMEGMPEGTYRLLTEAQWEYACRAGTQTALYDGDLVIKGRNNAPALDPIGWYGGNSGVEYAGAIDSSGWPEKQYEHKWAGTHPVGGKRANGFGLCDMIGNVWEWCHDWYDVYPSGTATDPLGPASGAFRVLRGGGWHDKGAGDDRSANRVKSTPGNFSSHVGLRIARTIPSASDIPEYKNFGDVVDKLSHTKFDVSVANREPPDIDPKAKELKDAGMDLFNKENRFREGIEKIEAALKIDPRMPDAYNILALYYALTKKDPQTAVRYLEEGIKNCPKSSLVRISLGNVYAQMNQPRKAIEQFTAAMELGVEVKAPVLYNIGNAYKDLDRLADAISYYRKALSEDEKHLNARRNLVIALVLSGDRKAARQEAQRLLELDPNGESGNWARQALQKIDSP